MNQDWQANISLRKLNTFGIEAKASYFKECYSLTDIIETLGGKPSSTNLFVLGGGSNILFTKDFDGLVLQPALKGIEILDSDSSIIQVRVAAAEEWDGFVEWAVAHEFGGIENLSLIPGRVGSCPIQNIGAYGTEVKDVIEAVEYIDLQDLKTRVLKKEECNFGYRNSIFKNELKNKILITHVRFLLKKKFELITSYGTIADELKAYPVITIRTVRDAVCSIRRRKLPDPEEIGNAGSFFKNPTLIVSVGEKLKAAYPEMPYYTTDEASWKIPAGWLIENCGWKGYRKGDAGVHKNQALVLVNYGSASGSEILDLAKDIQASVLNRFGITLEMEVNIL